MMINDSQMVLNIGGIIYSVKHFTSIFKLSCTKDCIVSLVDRSICSITYVDLRKMMVDIDIIKWSKVNKKGR